MKNFICTYLRAGLLIEDVKDPAKAFSQEKIQEYNLKRAIEAFEKKHKDAQLFSVVYVTE